MTLLPIIALCPVLVAVAVRDLSQLRIPNALVLAAVVIFAACYPLLPAGEISDRLLAAAVVFAMLLPLFAARLIGGGDAKMLPAVVLFVPPDHWQQYGLLLSASLVVGVIAVGTARAAVSGYVPTGWAALDRRGTFPMGLSIALSGLALAASMMLEA
jgi:prepilin peptidase CpaA